MMSLNVRTPMVRFIATALPASLEMEHIVKVSEMLPLTFCAVKIIIHLIFFSLFLTTVF